MTNNEVFKRILNLTGCGIDKQNLIEIFRSGGVVATSSRIKRWRTQIDGKNNFHMSDEALDGFLNGLFKYRDEQEKKGVRVFNFT